MTDLPPATTVKRMRLRYAGVCARCGMSLAAGVTADYDRATRTVACVECPPRHALPDPWEAAAAPDAVISPDVRAELEAADGTPGCSAAREFDRRHDARQERVQARRPKIGRFLLAVFDDPQSTTAWSSGAVGEQALGEMLSSMAGPMLRVLHDRRIPRSRANIDHLVVCPSGVFVVDAKRYRNARPALRVVGGLIRPRQELLFVGGRDHTKLVDGMRKQLDLVRAALSEHVDVPVHGVLCFVDANWPVIGGSFTVKGVAAVWPKKLKTTLTAPGPLDADLQWQLHEAFPRQKEPTTGSR